MATIMEMLNQGIGGLNTPLGQLGTSLLAQSGPQAGNPSGGGKGAALGAKAAGLNAGRAALVGAGAGGVEAANKMARASGSDAFWTFYKSALLSSPDTHIVNMVSNLFTAGLQVPTRILAGGIGTAKRLATGGRAGETRMGESAYQLAGALEGAINGAIRPALSYEICAQAL